MYTYQTIDKYYKAKGFSKEKKISIYRIKQYISSMHYLYSMKVKNNLFFFLYIDRLIINIIVSCSSFTFTRENLKVVNLLRSNVITIMINYKQRKKV